MIVKIVIDNKKHRCLYNTNLIARHNFYNFSINEDVCNWLEENIGNKEINWNFLHTPCVFNNLSVAHKIFEFNNEEDAMAFKLRWM